MPSVHRVVLENRPDYPVHVVARGLQMWLEALLAQRLAGDGTDRDEPAVRPDRLRSAGGLEEVADRRGGGEGDVIGGERLLEDPRRGRPRHRLTPIGVLHPQPPPVKAGWAGTRRPGGRADYAPPA